MTRRYGIEFCLAFILLAACVAGKNAAQAAGDSWIGPAPTGAVYPTGEETRRFNTISANIKQRSQIKTHEAQTFHKEAMILDSDRDPLDVVLRRTRALLNDITHAPDAPDMKVVGELQAEAEAVKKKKSSPTRRSRSSSRSLRSG